MRGGASCEKLIRVLGFNNTQPMKSSLMGIGRDQERQEVAIGLEKKNKCFRQKEP